MKCPNCEFDNRKGAKFCGKCRTKLSLTCPQCHSDNPPDNDFCDECGHDLGMPEETPAIDYSEPQSYTPKFLADKILTTRSSIEGERKLVTVLFADVANFTAVSERLDPEDVHQIMDGCFKILMDEIHRYEGTINQFTGDGVMALFGAPVAHEDHAQQACRAALSIQNAINEYGDKIRRDLGVEFRMRIGLNSGHVIVGSIGDDLRMDYTAVGDTTNLAARIQQAAKPGEAWMSKKTRNIVRDYFHEEPAGKMPLKGKAEAQSLYRLVSERPGVRTRFEADLVRGVTELVGRRPELESLRSAFEKAKAGKGQVVDVIGEAGVGKSRLVYEFREALDEDVAFLTGICIHYGRNINFLPVIDVVKEAFGIEEGMTEEEVENRIEEETKESLQPMTPFYRNLISLKVDDAKFKNLDPEGRKFGTFEAMKDLLFALSENKPMVLFLDDVHWIDKVSDEFFTYLSRSMLDHRILMLAAYRPEATPSWAQGTHYYRLGLETLSTQSSIRLVRNILGGVKLDPDLEQTIVEKTEGNPFFVEEIVRELLERGDLIMAGDGYMCEKPIDQCEIPNTVQGVLAARMDRLSEDLKRTMQVASVIGRDFAFRLLKSIMALGDELRTHLNNLVGLEILYEKALYPELEYIFKHALTQEVAYESLLKQRRREIHDRIAQTIEQLYADRLEQHYEVLSYHYERSGNAKKAADYLILAGEKSQLHHAVGAAREFFQKALEMTESAHIALIPEKKVRLHHGLAKASEDVGDIATAFEQFRETIELSQYHGILDYEKKSLGGLATMIYQWPVRVEVEQTLKEAMDRAQEIGDKDLESMILSQMGLVAGTHGEPHIGNQMAIDAEQKAMETGNPRPIMLARGIRAVMERWLGRPTKTVELTEVPVEAIPSSFGVGVFADFCWIRGVALAEIGRVEDAIALMRSAMDLCEKVGAFLGFSKICNCIGYCYGEIYQLDQASKFNLKSEDTARRLMEEYPATIPRYAEIRAQASVNLIENLFDQAKLDAAWDRIESLQEESKSKDYDALRSHWESRMNYVAGQILLVRNALAQAESIVEKNLESVRREHVTKREGSFLRLLGELQIRRNEFDNAINSLSEAVLVLKKVGNPRQLWQAHGSLATGFSKLGRSGEAREHLAAAAEIVIKAGNGLLDRQLREDFLQAEPIREILSKVSA